MGAEPNQSDPRAAAPLESVLDLLDIAGQMRSTTVVVAGGHRVEDLRLVESARDHGIVDRILLVGDAGGIRAAVDEVGIEIAGEDIVPAEGDEQVAAATVEIVRDRRADIVLKGGISTPIINRRMLSLAQRPTVSLATVFDAAPLAGGRPMVMTDAGVTTVCNFGRLVDLVDNAVDVARTVTCIDRPRVAILSANEKQIPSLPSTWLGKQLAGRDWPHADVYGPLSFDLATDPGSVAIKGLPAGCGAEEVAGRADVLVCPGIDAANVLYKLISALNKYGEASLASITVGFPAPYIILSRADSLETRLVSVALSAVYAQRKAAARQAGRAEAVVASGRPPRRPAPRVLAVNPGSTSVKVAVFEGDRCVRESEAPCELALGGSAEQRRARAAELAGLVEGLLAEWGVTEVDALAGRGGFLPRPAGKLASGAYVVAERQDGRIVVDERIVAAALEHPEAEHASNYGAAVAAALAARLGAPAVIVDPVGVDEFCPEAEISGYAPIARRSTSHALSVRAAVRKAAEAVGRSADEMNVVVAHLGGGITVAAVRGGQMVDNNIALLGGGPFTPQRAGDLPLGELVDLCYSGRFTRDELIAELTKRGGLQSYLGTDRMEEIEQRIADGDEQASAIVDAMVYQIAKEIGRAYVAAGCDVDAIVLTGGLVHSDRVRNQLRRRVGRLAPMLVFPGSLEMAALAAGAGDVLAGRAEARRYVPPTPQAGEGRDE